MRKYKWHGKNNLQIMVATKYGIMVKPDASPSDYPNDEGRCMTVQTHTNFLTMSNGLYVYAYNDRETTCTYGELKLRPINHNNKSLVNVDYRVGDRIVFSSLLMKNDRYHYTDLDLTHNVVLPYNMVYARFRNDETLAMNLSVLVQPLTKRSYYRLQSESNLVLEFDITKPEFGYVKVTAASADYDGIKAGDVVVVKQDFYGVNGKEWCMSKTTEASRKQDLVYLGEKLLLPNDLFGGYSDDQFYHTRVHLNDVIAKVDDDGEIIPLHEMLLIELDERDDKLGKFFTLPPEQMLVKNTGTIVAQGELVEADYVGKRAQVTLNKDTTFYLRDYSEHKGRDYVLVYSENSYNSGVYCTTVIEC